jgi:hypothetical protein
MVLITTAALALAAVAVAAAAVAMQALAALAVVALLVKDILAVQAQRRVVFTTLSAAVAAVLDRLEPPLLLMALLEMAETGFHLR